jgi:hypothetical protein
MTTLVGPGYGRTERPWLRGSAKPSESAVARQERARGVIVGTATVAFAIAYFLQICKPEPPSDHTPFAGSTMHRLIAITVVAREAVLLSSDLRAVTQRQRTMPRSLSLTPTATISAAWLGADQSGALPAEPASRSPRAAGRARNADRPCPLPAHRFAAALMSFERASRPLAHHCDARLAHRCATHRRRSLPGTAGSAPRCRADARHTTKRFRHI